MKPVKRLFTQVSPSTEKDITPKKAKSSSSKSHFLSRTKKHVSPSKATLLPSRSFSLPTIPKIAIRQRHAMVLRSHSLAANTERSSTTAPLRIPRPSIKPAENYTSRQTLSQSKEFLFSPLQTRQKKHAEYEEKAFKVSHDSAMRNIPNLSPKEILSAAWNSSLHKWDLKMVSFLSGPSKFPSVVMEAKAQTSFLGKTAYRVFEEFFISGKDGYFIPNSDINLNELKNSLLETFIAPGTPAKENILSPYKKARFMPSSAKHEGKESKKYSIPTMFIPGKE